MPLSWSQQHLKIFPITRYPPSMFCFALLKLVSPCKLQRRGASTTFPDETPWIRLRAHLLRCCTPGLAQSLLDDLLLDEQMKWKVDSPEWDQKGVKILKKRDVFFSHHTGAASLTGAERPRCPDSRTLPGEETIPAAQLGLASVQQAPLGPSSS